MCYHSTDDHGEHGRPERGERGQGGRAATNQQRRDDRGEADCQVERDRFSDGVAQWTCQHRKAKLRATQANQTTEDRNRDRREEGQASAAGGSVSQTHCLTELLDAVDVVYTTRWQTTGTTKPDPAWREVFRPYYVDQRFMARWPRAIFMHDLPAHRGEEVVAAYCWRARPIAWLQASDEAVERDGCARTLRHLRHPTLAVRCSGRAERYKPTRAA